MRNLKKILALVLALVMSFSLMATANAFTDDKDIDATYDEAVTVLSNLKVFQGYENGSFQPKGDITRAEVAAIIYRIVTGDVTDAQVAIYKDYNKFDDVKSTSWYAGYVNYCANAEYIKGYDAKTFGPNDKVTGYQALAMILRAVGYDRNGEFTGAGWQVQVASVAKSLHISDNVTAGTLGGSAPREVVAELLFRSILVPQVTYSAAFGYQNIGLTTGAIANTNNVLNSAWLVHNDSIGAETFGLEMISGEISAVGRAAGTTTLVDRSTAANGTALNPVTVTNTDTPWTDIGYAAYVYTVPTAGTKTREAVSDVVITGQSLKVTTDGTEITDAKVTVEEGAHLYYNGEYIGQILNYGAGNPTNGQIAKYLLNKDGKIGVKVDYIDNDNGGRAEVVVVTEYSVATVTGITNANNTGWNAIVEGSTYLTEHATTGAASTSYETVAVADSNLVADAELAYGDLVTYVEYPGSFKGDHAATKGDYYVTKTPVVTGAYSRINYNYTANKDTSYVIGETTYLVSEVNSTCNTDALTYLRNQANVGKDADVYADPYGHILHVNEAAVARNYLFVYAHNHSNLLDKVTDACVVYPNGTVSRVTLGLANAEYFTSIPQHIYAYTDKDGIVNIKKTSAQDGQSCTSEILASQNATLRTNKVNIGNTNLYLSNQSVIVDVRNVNTATTTEVPVYTGYANVPNLNNVVMHYIANNGVIVLAYLVSATSYTAPTDFVVYTTGAHYYSTDAAGVKTYKLPVIQDGEKKEILLNETQYQFICNLGTGIYYFGDQGEIIPGKSFTAFTENSYYITWNNGLLLTDTAGNRAGFAFTENTKLFTLDITNGEAYAYNMNFGIDGTVGAGLQHVLTNATKLAYVVSVNGVATEVYVIDGTLATAAGVTNATNVDATVYSKTVTVNGVDYLRTYTRKNAGVSGDAKGYITAHTDAKIDPTLTNNLRLVQVFGETVEATGEGAGTQEDPFTYVAQVCNTATTGTAPRLRVMDNNVAADMELWNKTVTSKVGDQTGVGEIADQGTSVSSSSLWMVKSDGVWYSVKVEVLSEATTLTSSDPTEIKVDGTSNKIQIASNVADKSDTDAEVQAALEQYLTVAAGATMTYAAGKVTVTPACAAIHSDHVVEYTVEFVTSIS